MFIKANNLIEVIDLLLLEKMDQDFLIVVSQEINYIFIYKINQLVSL